MKKIIALAAAALVAGGALFAGDFYNGDIQLQLGVASDSVKLQDVSNKVNSVSFDFGLESYHLFKPVESFGVGFVIGFNGGVGSTDSWTSYGLTSNDTTLSANFNFSIGPAIAAYIGNVVRFATTFGFDAGFKFDTPFAYTLSGVSAWTSVMSGYAGFDFGFQAKFVPNSPVSPVIGWRIVKGFSDAYDVSVYDSYDGIETTNVTKKYTLTQNVFYLAVSFNW